MTLATLAAATLLALTAPQAAQPTAPQAAQPTAPQAAQPTAPQAAQPTAPRSAQAAPYGSAGCAGVPRSLPDLPVADAIAAVPNLSILASRIGGTEFAAELNGVPQVTVFAPADEAFETASGPAQLDETLLRYHVVPKRLTPERLIGTHRTLQGGQLSVTRGDAHVRVNATAALICTRVEAANGNVYLIDALLTPR